MYVCVQKHVSNAYIHANTDQHLQYKTDQRKMSSLKKI